MLSTPCPKSNNSFVLRIHSCCFPLTPVEAFSEGLSDLPKVNNQWVQQLGLELGFANSQAPGVHCGSLLLWDLFFWLPDGKAKAQMVLVTLQMPRG